MHKFTDMKDRVWDVVMDISAVKRVRDLMKGKVNLLELQAGNPPLMSTLCTDIMLFCDVLYCLIEPQATKLDVDDVEFGSSLGGETILAAQEAFFNELVLFFRGFGRKDLARALTKQAEVVQLAVTRCLEEINKINLQKEVDSVFSNSSTKSQESSESTPDPSHSAN